MGIKVKILLPAIALTVLVSGAILFSNIILFSDFVTDAAAARVDAASKVAVHHLEDLKMRSAAAALSVAEHRDVAAALAGHDRVALTAQVTQMLEEAEIDFCVVTDQDGVVILRTYDPGNFGDFAAGAAVQAAVAGERLTAVEADTVIRLSVRSASPVLDDNGAVIGTVSAGYRLDTDPYVDLTKEISGCEATVSLRNERIATTVLNDDGTRAVGTQPDQNVSEIVMAGDAYTGRSNILGRAAVSCYVPLTGADGQVVGMLFTGQYLDETAKTTTAFVRTGSIIALIALAGFIAVILFITGRIVTPLWAMTQAASALAAGDTNIDIRVNTKDEMRTLAGAFNSMAENARTQVRMIEAIAGGGLTAPIVARSEKDLVNRALEKLNETIKTQAAAIREEHERVLIMLDSTPLTCHLWSRDLRMIECNEAAVKLFGLKSKKEYIDRFLEMSPTYQPDGRETGESIRAAVNEAFETGACTYAWMYQMLDGTPIPAEVTLVRVPYGGGYAVAVYSRDLREQNKMMAEIEQRDRLLETVNQAIDRLLRAEPEDFSETLRRCMGMIARTINADRMYLHQNIHENGKMRHVKLYEWQENTGPFPGAGGSGCVCEGRAPLLAQMRADGDSVHRLARDLPEECQQCQFARGVMSTMLIPVFLRNEFWGFAGFDNCHSEALFTENEGSVLRSGSLLIVSALLRNDSLLRIRETSAKLETALTDAKEANNAKSDFLAHMSHEMRTPLNAVIGLSEITLDDKDLNEDAKSNLEKIYNSGSTLLSIVNDVLDISKIQSGKFEIIPNQYDVPSLINDTVLQNVLRIGSRPVRFILDVDENMPACLYGDELRVRQVINNLLSNAIKYTEEGEVEIGLHSEHSGGSVWLTIRVRDTGEGIRPENMANLFNDYAQFGGTAKRREGGTGLGLSITKSLSGMMDGSVTAQSEYGKGSVFTARLRQGYVSDTVIGAGVAQSLKSFQYSASKLKRNSRLNRVQLPYARVLVVDDNITNLDVARGLLKPYGMKIDCVTGGVEAIQIIRGEKTRYNAIFMDHMMPEMDGVEAVRVIREEIGTEYARTVPVIALTANAVAGSEDMFLNSGFQGFISKPIDIARLDEMIRRFVRDKNQETETEETVMENEPPAGDSALLDWGRNIVGLDIAAGLERYGDENALTQVLRSYAINTKNNLDSIRNITADTLRAYAVTVHGLKGASRNIFAETAGALAEELEDAAKAGNLNFVIKNNPYFIETVEDLAADINGLLRAVARASPKPTKDRPDTSELRRLYEACVNYDFNTIDEIAEAIGGYAYTMDGGLAEWLTDNIIQMNFDGVMERLSTLNLE